MSVGIIILVMIGSVLGIMGALSYLVWFAEGWEIEDRIELVLIFLFPIGIFLVLIKQRWKELGNK